MTSNFHFSTKKIRQLLYLSLFCCLYFSPLKAENIRYDYSFEELMNITVTSTSFFEQKISEAPGHIQVLDISKLELAGYYSLSDLLEHYATGSYIGSHPRNGAIHGVRGVLVDNGAKTLVMINGQQINPRSNYGSGLILNSQFLGDVDKVEVINGPGAILHGSGAINGFLNLVSKRGDTHEGGFATLTYGFKDQLKKLETGYGFNFAPEHNLYLYGGILEADGYTADNTWGLDPADSAGYETNAWEDDNFKVSAYYNYQNFNLQAFFHQQHPTTNSKTGKANLNGEPFYSGSLGIQPKFIFELSDTESLEFTESLFLHEHGIDRSLAPRNGGRELHWNNKIVLKTTYFDNHSFAIGASYGVKEFDSAKHFFKSDPKAGFESLNTDWQDYSFFAEDIWKITDRLTLSFGLRFDTFLVNEIETNRYSYTPDNTESLSPRIALAYKINDDHNIKISYQRGFRMPDISYYAASTRNNFIAESLGYSTIPLEPETVDSFELNYNWNYSEKLQLGLNLFYNEYEDQLFFGPIDNLWSPSEVADILANPGFPGFANQNQNSQNDSQTYGFELSSKYQILENTKVKLSYSYVKLAGIDIQRYPSHLVKINLLSHFMNNKLTVGTNYLMNTGLSEEDTPNRNEIYSSPRHIIDVFLNYKISQKLSTQLSVENLFESNIPRYSSDVTEAKGNLGTDARRVYLSLTYNF